MTPVAENAPPRRRRAPLEGDDIVSTRTEELALGRFNSFVRSSNGVRMVMIHVYYVVVLIVRQSGDGHQPLIARRNDAKYMGGTCQLISGGLNPGETAWQGALREMQEETGLRPQEFYRLSTLTSFYRPDKDSLNTAPMFCAIVAKNAAVTINGEHTDFEWVDVNDADNRLMWRSDLGALEEVRSVILGGGMAKEYLRIPL
jgi:dihydroneopterin triphosphate diphosphatase